MLLIYLFEAFSMLDKSPTEMDLLVEERLENNDLIAGLNETHKSTQHTCFIPALALIH